MTYFHKVSSLKDEEEILKNIINLETAVRAKQEVKRLQENTEHFAASIHSRQANLLGLLD